MLMQNEAPVTRAARGAPADDDSPAVKSIARAVNVLTCLGEGLHTLTDIAVRCRLNKSTVHRLLRALEDAGLAAQHKRNRRYYPGPLITRLAAESQAAHGDLICCAIGEMRRLSDRFGETVNLCVMPALQNLVVCEIGGTYHMTFAPDLASTNTAYAGSFFRMQLAQLSEQRLKAVVKRLFARDGQVFGRTGREELLRRVQEARQQGYTVFIEESLPGIVGVAAPVHSYACPAVIGVIGPEHRMRARTGEVIREVLDSVRRVSENVSRYIGPSETGAHQ